MHHTFDTQKNESMNTKIARLCPKTITLSRSMVLSDRVAWVVMEDSLGGSVAVVKLYKQLHLGEVPFHLLSYYMKNDKKREYQHQLKLLPEMKYRRNKDKHERIRLDRHLAEEDRKNGKAYMSGMAVQEKSKQKKTPKLAEPSSIVCSSCGLAGHRRKSNRLCPHNKYYVRNIGGADSSGRYQIKQGEESQQQQITTISTEKEDTTGDQETGDSVL